MGFGRLLLLAIFQFTQIATILSPQKGTVHIYGQMALWNTPNFHFGNILIIGTTTFIDISIEFYLSKNAILYIYKGGVKVIFQKV
jgi:hypothetical protein